MTCPKIDVHHGRSPKPFVASQRTISLAACSHGPRSTRSASMISTARPLPFGPSMRKRGSVSALVSIISAPMRVYVCSQHVSMSDVWIAISKNRSPLTLCGCGTYHSDRITGAAVIPADHRLSEVLGRCFPTPARLRDRRIRHRSVSASLQICFPDRTCQAVKDDQGAHFEVRKEGDSKSYASRKSFEPKRCSAR
jgi:hypothetical protein